MSITPLFDRILAEPKTEQVSNSGLYIPTSSAERSQIMLVLATGNGELDNGEKTTMTVKQGDTVIVSKYAGSELVYESKKLYILRQCDILAKLT